MSAREQHEEAGDILDKYPCPKTKDGKHYRNVLNNGNYDLCYCYSCGATIRIYKYTGIDITSITLREGVVATK